MFTSKRDKILNPLRKEAIAAVGRHINAVAEKFPELKVKEVHPHSAENDSIGNLYAFFSISGDAEAYSEETGRFYTALIRSKHPSGVIFNVTSDSGYVKVLIPDFYTHGTKALEALIDALNKATHKLKYGDNPRFVDVQAERAARSSGAKQLGS